MGLYQSLIETPFLDMYVLFGGALILIVLAISSLLVWFLARHHVETRKRVLKIIGIVSLVVLLGGILVLMRDTLSETKRQIISDIPGPVKQVADDYVISKVGNEYFQNNFSFNKRESVQWYKSTTYSVKYDFLPLKEFTYNDIIEVLVYDGEAHEGRLSEIPDCIADKSMCQFNLTKEDFISIAERNDVKEVLSLQPPFVKALICPNTTIVYVDYRTKEVTLEDARDEFYLCHPAQF